MIFALKTDNSTAELAVFSDNGELLNEKKWLAERRLAKELLGEIEEIIEGKWEELTGIIVFQGPGSFTGLRIGITTVNTMAYAQNIPIIGVKGEDWVKTGLKRLQNSENDKIVLPEYGGEANITQPRK